MKNYKIKYLGNDNKQYEVLIMNCNSIQHAISILYSKDNNAQVVISYEELTS